MIAPIEQLRDIMQKLRDPQTGCAWDIRQDFKSIATFTLEEAYEVVDAIERGDIDDLKDELGDLLLQVIFHTQMASEQNLFNFDDVAQAISDKMLRRHPHVFGDTVFNSEAELKASWESIKAQERRDKLARKRAAVAASDSALELDGDTGQDANLVAAPPSALDGIAPNLPALKRADKIQKRAARVGFDWPAIEPVWGKLAEEIDEVREALAKKDDDAVKDEIGDLLFTVVNLARHAGVDSEAALSQASRKFDSRFRRVEVLAADSDKPMGEMELASLDSLWNKAKQQD